MQHSRTNNDNNAWIDALLESVILAPHVPTFGPDRQIHNVMMGGFHLFAVINFTNLRALHVPQLEKRVWCGGVWESCWKEDDTKGI